MEHGDSLPQLQQRFFAYRQTNEDLLTYSLALVTLYDKIGERDASFKACRNTTLKGRLAEAVRDEGLRRELHRLNLDNPDLSYFDVRDRAQQWLGNAGHVKVEQVKSRATHVEMQNLIEEQGRQLQELQELVREIQVAPREKPGGAERKHWERKPDSQRLCWRCGAADHLQRNCPQPSKRGQKTQP